MGCANVASAIARGKTLLKVLSLTTMHDGQEL
jgi:hypothetical protein